MEQNQIPESKSPFFSVRIQSVPRNIPLPFDIYLALSKEHVLFRKSGDILTNERSLELIKHGVAYFFIPTDQKDTYRNALKELARNTELPKSERAVILKESAFNHVADLFSNPDVQKIANESVGLIEEMVSFISGDLEAASSLMKLTSHDYYTYNHSVHVAVYSISITKQFVGNDKKQLIYAGLGGLLHDLGKRQVSLDIINKPGKLSPEEWIEMKKHPTYGMELVDKVKTIPEESKRMVYEHHEHLDGTGYPRGLQDSQISKLSRIAAVADVFDALTTKRSYKQATTALEALSIMREMSDGKFDPEIFKSLDRKVEERPKLIVAEDADPCSANFKTKKAA